MCSLLCFDCIHSTLLRLHELWHGGVDVTEAQVALTAAVCGSGFSSSSWQSPQILCGIQIRQVGCMIKHGNNMVSKSVLTLWVVLSPGGKEFGISIKLSVKGNITSKPPGRCLGVDSMIQIRKSQKVDFVHLDSALSVEKKVSSLVSADCRFPQRYMIISVTYLQVPGFGPESLRVQHQTQHSNHVGRHQMKQRPLMRPLHLLHLCFSYRTSAGSS